MGVHLAEHHRIVLASDNGAFARIECGQGTKAMTDRRAELDAIVGVTAALAGAIDLNGKPGAPPSGRTADRMSSRLSRFHAKTDPEP
jgi:hypothetical protein